MTFPWAGVSLLFDLDGTLVDTAADLAGTMNDQLIARGLEALPVTAVRDLVGQGARALIVKGFAARGAAPGEEEIEALREEFIEIYATRIARESRPFSGVVSTLDRLKAEGARLAVVTNKPIGLTQLLLDALDLQRPFGAVIGYESAPRPKPHREPIDLAIATLKGDPSRAVMIGDSATDVGAARAAGIPVIAVSYGYTPTPAHLLGADRVIDGFDALPPALRAILEP